MIENTAKTPAKPFLKWAGGKTQLLDEIDKRLPIDLKEGNIKRYIEPFVGSGAVFFYLVSHYNIEEAILIDINSELVNAYNVVKRDIEALIHTLEQYEKEFLPLEKEMRKETYYNVRKSFNDDLNEFNFRDYGKKNITRAAQFIFLNKTCFNGLFRVNKSGKYNVPMGDYKNPTICNSENLRNVNKVLQSVTIIEGDYKASRDFCDSNTFVYFDPPYKPLSISSSFTSYSKFDFKDKEQEELSEYFRELHELDAKLMLSNSDPEKDPEQVAELLLENPNLKEESKDMRYFDILYKGFNVRRVSAKRSINSKGNKRGQIDEVLITNY